MPSDPITGAILSGGANTRIAGSPVALLPFGGEKLIERQIREMRKICDEIIVVTNTPKPFFAVVDSEVRIITDFFSGCGPLGGMHAALHLARHPLIWIAGGDMPLLSADATHRLARRIPESWDAVVPLVDGRPIALHGLYRRRCAAAAAHLLARGEKEIVTFLGLVRWRGMPADNWTEAAPPGRFDFRIQGERDYEAALRLIGNEHAPARTPGRGKTEGEIAR